MTNGLKIAFGAGIASLLVISGSALAASNSSTTVLKTKATATPKVAQTNSAAEATSTPSAAMAAESTSKAQKTSGKKLIQGQVKSVQPGNLVLDLPRNKPNLSLTTNNSTTFYIGNTTGSISDIKTNDDVIAIINANKKEKNLKSAVAVAIAVLPRDDKSVSIDNDPNIVAVRGEVDNISATSFSITDRRSKKTYSVTVDSQAKVIEPGKASGALTTLKKAGIVTVYGTQKDNTLAAKIVLENPDNRSDRYTGVLVGINGGKLLIFSTDDEAINVDASNAIIVQRGNPAATLGSLKDGHNLSLFGIKNSDGTVTAQIMDEFDALGRPYNPSKKQVKSEVDTSKSSTTVQPTSTPSK